MIELSNSNAQTLSGGQSATFDTILLHTGCAEFFRQNTNFVNLTQKCAIYEISFNCNIGGTEAGDAQIGISLNNSPLKETVGMVVTATAGDLENVSGSTYIKTCCCENDTILLTNTGTTSINIGANPRFSIKRIA
jgi:hypothetical protein